MQLNKDTAWLKPGQILIVADPLGDNQTQQINSLAIAKEGDQRACDFGWSHR